MCSFCLYAQRRATEVYTIWHRRWVACWFLGETRARSSGCTLDGCGDTIDDFSANGGLSAEENPEFSGGLDG